MTIKNLFTFHIIVPMFFGLSAIGAVSDGVYGFAFLCALFCFMFTAYGWRLALRWFQLPESFAQYRWWCAGAAFIAVGFMLSANPEFKAMRARDEAQRAKTKALEEELRETNRLADEAEDRRRKANRDPFASLFSAWDNSCRPLVAATKARLKDPDSFQHIKTGFYRVNDVVHVTMEYRARNSFNGYTVGKATADVYADGKVANLVLD